MNKIYFIVLLALISCANYEKSPNGRKYYLSDKCIKSHTERATGYHYGFNLCKMKFEMHFPICCSCTNTICDEHKTDTVWIR